MKRHLTLTIFAVGTTLLMTAAAQAHPGHAGHGSFGAGFGHPLSGIDHMLAMVAVGLLAAQIGGRAIWALPLAFVGMMLAGGLLNLAHVTVPFTEQGICASVFVLGLAIAVSARLPIIAPVSLVGLFAIFHGYAHVAEMSVGSTPASYGLGFVLATSMLHIAGIGAGLGLRRIANPATLRAIGAGIAACGLLLALGIISA